MAILKRNALGPKSRLVLVAVAYSLLAIAASAQDAPELRFPDRSDTRSVRVILQQSGPYVRHRMEGTQYRIQLSYRENLYKNPSVAFEMVSYEAGRWSNLSVQFGSLVEFTNDRILAQNKQKPQPGQLVRFTFRRKEGFGPEVVAARFKAEMSRAEEIARLQAEAKRTPRRVHALLKLVLIDRLRRYGNLPTDETLSVLGTPKFLGLTADPEETLLKLCQWIQLDHLMQATGLNRPTEMSEIDLLNMYREATQLLMGEKTDPGSFRHLNEGKIATLQRAGRVAYTADFVPYGVEEAPDRLWSVAPQVGLQPGGVRGVQWQGSVGVRSRHAQWLCVLGEGDLQIQTPDQKPAFYWALVTRSKDMHYVRVTPRGLDSTAKFLLRLSFEDVASDWVQVVSDDPRSVSFPF